MSDNGYLAAAAIWARWLCLFLLCWSGVFLAYVFWPHPQARGVEAFGEDVRGEYIRVHAATPDTFRRRVAHVNATAHHWLFVRTGWDAWLKTETTEEKTAAESFFDHLPLALLYESRLLALRLALLWEHAPWFGLVLFLAAVDGWAGWTRRRHTGARESAFVFRHAGVALALAAAATFLVYPLAPWPIDPVWALTAAPAALGLGARFFICYFRKHI